jgi:hypothetical protein
MERVHLDEFLRIVPRISGVRGLKVAGYSDSRRGASSALCQGSTTTVSETQIVQR